MSEKITMFAKYPDVVEINQLREMLGGINCKLTYILLADNEIPKACVI